VKPLVLESEEFQELSLRILDDDVGIFQPLPSSLFISRAKLVFNSVSYSKLVSETHDICHCQAQKLSFHQKDTAQQDHFPLYKEKIASYPVLFYCFT